MIPEHLITKSVFAMNTSDTGMQALSWMGEFKVLHLPIVNNEKLLGVISEDDIFKLNDPEAPIGNHRLSLQKPYVFKHQHIYDVIKIVHENKLSLVPVIDDKENYIGVIGLYELTQFYSELASANQPGGVIVLAVDVNNYMVSQIGQIIEENDAHILSLYTLNSHNSNKVDIYIKIDKTDLRPIIKSFERFDYDVLESYMESDFNNELEDRYDSLMHYLNI